MRKLSALPLPLVALVALAGCQSGEPTDNGTPPTPSAANNASAGAPVTGGSDWAQWRGPKADGFSPDKIANKAWGTKAPAELWKVDMSDGGNAGPSVADGKVFIVDHQGDQDVVRAFELSNGAEAWKFPYPAPGGNDNGFCRSTPVVDGGMVYVLSRDGLLNCIGAKDGKPVWSRDIQKEMGGQRPQWGYSMSPFIDGNKVIVVPGGGAGVVAALDKASGKTLWQGGGGDAPGYATPVLATINGTAQYVVFTAKNVIGVDAQSGNRIWASPWVTSYDVNAATPLVIGNTVFITTGYGTGCALVQVNGSSASVKWQNKEMQSHFSSPIYFDGHIYGTTDPGDLVCLSAANGSAVWRKPGFEKGGVVAADGVIIALNGGGGEAIMTKLAPTSGEELGRFTPLGGKSWTAPIIAHNRLIVRNEKTLACYSLE